MISVSEHSNWHLDLSIQEKCCSSDFLSVSCIEAWELRCSRTQAVFPGTTTEHKPQAYQTTPHLISLIWPLSAPCCNSLRFLSDDPLVTSPHVCAPKRSFLPPFSSQPHKVPAVAHATCFSSPTPSPGVFSQLLSVPKHCSPAFCAVGQRIQKRPFSRCSSSGLFWVFLITQNKAKSQGLWL